MKRDQSKVRIRPSQLDSMFPRELDTNLAAPSFRPTPNRRWGHHFAELSLFGAQPKLDISRPEDPGELEADRIADEVMERKEWSFGNPVRPSPAPQRQCDASEGEEEEQEAGDEEDDQLHRKGSEIREPSDPSRALAATKTMGQPLDDETRAFMEPRFGFDFSRVRVHVDNEATRSVSARAYTLGYDVVFGAGRYAPGTQHGRRLLAHELTHVVQQSNTPRSIVQRDGGGMTSPTAPASVPAGTGGPSQSTPTADDISDRKKIDKALASKDVGDVKDIRNYAIASDDEKRQLIEILLNQGWVGPRDEYALEAIWRSWGAYAIKFASTPAGFSLWEKCIDRGAELDDLPVIDSMKKTFVADIKTIVSGYLAQNDRFVSAEMKRLGLPEPGTEPQPPTQQQADEVQEMQAAAAIIAKLQKAREMVKDQVLVGYEPNPHSPTRPITGGGEQPQPVMQEPMFIPVFFDPLKPPPLDKDPSILGAAGAKVTPYKEVKDGYDEAGAEIEMWLEGYPSLYAITREGKSADTSAFAKQNDPALARKQLADAIVKLKADIAGAQQKLDNGGLDPLDLTPVHAQLTGGAIRGPSAIDWSGLLSKSVATGVVGSHDFNKVLTDLGLQGAAMALFMLAPFTGGASFFLVLAGAAVTAGKAVLSQQAYDAMSQASKTNVTPGTKLVGEGQVEHLRRAMEADRIAVALAAIAVGTAAAGAAIRAIGGPALLAADNLATKVITEADLKIAQNLAQRALAGPIPEAELLSLQEVGLVTRVAQRWANYRGFQVLYRGQASATPEILSPIAREQGLASSVELYNKLKAEGLSDQEIANYTARWNGEPVPAFDAPPGMAGQPLGGVGIPSTRLPNVAADFAPGPTGVIYVLRVPKSVPVQVGSGGWGAQSAVEQEYVFFHQIPNGYVVRTVSPQGVGPLRFDSPPGVGPSLVTPPAPPAPPAP